MKKTAILISVLFLLLLSPTAFALTDTTNSLETSNSPSASGRGWFVFNGRRHNFAFSVQEGTLNETDNWSYAPNCNLSVTILNFKGDRLIQIKSARVWRYKTDQIEGGSRVVIVGVANVYTAIGVLRGWWFRAVAKDSGGVDTGVDSFSISLWRTGGAKNIGCWTTRMFDPEHQGSLRLNPTPFYTALGRLRGGTIEIQVI